MLKKISLLCVLSFFTLIDGSQSFIPQRRERTITLRASVSGEPEIPFNEAPARNYGMVPFQLSPDYVRYYRTVLQRCQRERRANVARLLAKRRGMQNNQIDRDYENAGPTTTPTSPDPRNPNSLLFPNT